MDINKVILEAEDTFASLLELAANNDIEGFRRSIERDPSGIDEIGLWYGRQKGSKQMVLQHRTPLMVAATYGSIDVLKLILSLSVVDVNRSCGVDKSTALHCASSGGSLKAVEVAKLLLLAGADPNMVDANGNRPFDLINASPKFQDLKSALEDLLSGNGSFVNRNPSVSPVTSNSNSPPLSPPQDNRFPSSASDSTSSPKSSNFNELPVSSISEKKEYPVDPSLPDIKNSIYATDEFRMFSFKVRPCSRAYSHDWTECPFVHPGENARRRDPRKYHYSCVPCPDFRKGTCRRGDMCEYAHGVFECWLHPAQYRTRICKDGTSCNRRVCFFAHKPEELRPLYVSTGSAVPSPRSSSSTANAMDFAAAMSLLPGSPSSVSAMSPSPFTPPMSPSTNGISNMGWPQPNVPTLHLPGSNFQSSRLRASLNARDIPTEDLTLLPDFEVQQQQLFNELSRLSQPPPSIGLANSLNRSARSKALNPSNLDDMFSAESSSPRFSDQAIASAVYSPSHRLNQFQQHQNMLSPINTNFSTKNAEHPFLQGSYGVPSPRSVEPLSPISAHISMLGQREKHQQQFRSLSSRDLGSNSAAAGGSPAADSWTQWGSNNGGRPDWGGGVNANEFGKQHRRSLSFELGGNNGEEPDLSWVQSLVKETPQEMKDNLVMPGSAAAAPSSSDGSTYNSQVAEPIDQSVLCAWLEQMHLDQFMAM